MRPVIRHITNLQRAQISASKRYNKETEREKWDAWVETYQKILEQQIIPAQNEGAYVRLRPKDFDEEGNLLINVEQENEAS
jgi:hypothetical protein